MAGGGRTQRKGLGAEGGGLGSLVRGQSLSALPARAAEELNNLEQELGGRLALVTALTYAPLGRDMRYLLGLLGDPEHERLPLAECCRMGKVLPGQLIEALSKGTELRSRLLATQLIAQRTPAVVAEVMRKAAPYEDSCPHCQGLGSTTPDPTPEEPNPQNVLCKACLGHGRLQYDADGASRDLALEMAGLVGKGGGLNVQVTQQVAVTGGGAGTPLGFERMQEALDDLLYGATQTQTPDIVEGELAPGSAPGAAPGDSGPDGLGPVGGELERPAAPGPESGGDPGGPGSPGPVGGPDA